MNSALQKAITLDQADELAHVKSLFEMPADKIYFDGNSLGPLLSSTKKTVIDAVSRQWGDDLISSWNTHNWIDLPVSTGEKIAKLVGAESGQVICCDSISVNLFKVLHSALQLNPDRHVILSQQDNFPTDLYAAEGLQGLLGRSACNLKTINSNTVEEHLTEDVAVLLLTHVNFRTGRLHDMQGITHAAHERGIIVVWDLAHSVGVLPLSLDLWNLDFAVGCGYKYLNGGPGAPAFIYAAKRHQNRFTQPLYGWMGHEAPFEFLDKYSAARGISQFLTGTPPILSMTALNSALDLFDHVSIASIRRKSIALMTFFQELKEASPALGGLQLVSPCDVDQRGSQLAYSHPDAYSICQNLIKQNVVADYRSPDILRLGFSPLCLSFEDVYASVSRLNAIMASNSFLATEFATRHRVT